MRNKLFTFIKPYLSIIDKGIFFRKPFGWLYVIIAIASILAPVYLIYSAIHLNTAFEYRERCRIAFEKAQPEYEIAQQGFNPIQVTMEQYKTGERNASQRMRNANQNVNYYANYFQYYQQQYQSAQIEYQRAQKEYNDVRVAIQKYEPIWQAAKQKLEKANQEYQRTSQEYNSAQQSYYQIALPGSFHKNGIGSKAIIALVLYSIMALFAGWINFQLWWNRKSKLAITAKEDDEFAAIPVVAHFIQTIGESLGTMIVIIGFFTALFIAIFQVCFCNFYMSFLHANMDTVYIFYPIIYGFIAIIIFRIIAEGIKAIVVIANNTRNEKTDNKDTTDINN